MIPWDSTLLSETIFLDKTKHYWKSCYTTKILCCLCHPKLFNRNLNHITLVETSTQEPDNMIVLKVLETFELQHKRSGERHALDILHGHDVAFVVDGLDVHLLVDIVPQTETVQRVLAGMSKTMFTPEP